MNMIEIRHAGAGYDTFYRERSTRHPACYYRWLLRFLEPLRGRRLLDAACGEGLLVAEARRAGALACGVDLSTAALGLARTPPGLLAAAAGERLPFAAGSFDRVASVGSLEHYADVEAGARELFRVLAPGGLALVLLPNLFGLLWTVRHAARTGELFDDGQPLQRYATMREWEIGRASCRERV